MGENRKLPTKVLDLKDTCPLCDEAIHVGSKKSEGYPDKLQWWGDNDKAHYNWDGHKNTCNILHPEQGSGEGGSAEGGTSSQSETKVQHTETKQPSTEQIKKEAMTANGPMMVDCDWWERRWHQALRIAGQLHAFNDPNYPAERQHQIQAMAIMHDFASLEVARAFKKLLEAEKK